MNLSKVQGYVGLLMVFVGLALLSRDPSLLVLALPLLALVFMSSLLQPRGAPSLLVEREITPQSLTSAGPVKVELRIMNLSRETLRSVEITDVIPSLLTLASGTNRAVVDLKPKSRLTLEYRLNPPPRGLYLIGPATVRVADPLRLYPCEMDAGGSDPLYVYPERGLVRVRISTRRTGPWWGSTPTRRSGVGMEFYGLRDYQPGDELRFINWKASARLSRIVTNEYEPERTSDSVILIDAGRMSGSPAESKSILDYEAEACLAIASFLLNNGNRVGIALHGRFRHWLYPGFGNRQYLKIREQLMLARAGESEIPLSFLVSLLAPMILAPGSQIVLIAHVFSAGLPEAVVSLQSLGYSVTAILVEPSTGERTEDVASSLAARIVQLGMQETAMELQRLCPTVTWRVEESLDHVLRRLNLWVRRPGIMAE